MAYQEKKKARPSDGGVLQAEYYIVERKVEKTNTKQNEFFNTHPIYWGLHNKTAGKTYRLVKWEDYPISDATWEDATEEAISGLLQMSDYEKLDNGDVKQKHLKPIDDKFKPPPRPQVQYVPESYANITTYIKDKVAAGPSASASSYEFTAESLENLSSKITSTDQKINTQYILGLAKDANFLTAIQQNIKKLALEKWYKYYDILSHLQKQDYDTSEENKEFSMRPLIEAIILLAKEKSQTEISTIIISQNILSAIQDTKDGIETLTGDARSEMRDFLANQIFIFAKSINSFLDSFLNIAITGGPGTGKTKLAQVMGHVYGKLGLLLKDSNNVIVGSAKDVVGNFVGQTATKTNKFLGNGLESIIFIDEAYSIMGCTDKKMSVDGYGAEAITEIVNFLDVYRGLSVLVIAGYAEEIQNCFFAANPGLSRRFANQYELKNYDSLDLTAQFIILVNKRAQGPLIGPYMTNDIYKLISFLNESRKFPNQAGDISNLSSIFFKVIDSYPGVNWSPDPRDQKAYDVNLAMIGKTYKEYMVRR